jgi:hypothetical protein
VNNEKTERSGMHIAHRKYAMNDGAALPFHQFPPCTLEDVQACLAQNAREAARLSDDDHQPSRWEERFDPTYIDALLQLLNAVCDGLPAFVQRWLLRRATRLPGLHGHFAQHNGEVSFFDKDGSISSPSETWIIHENGAHDKLW